MMKHRKWLASVVVVGAAVGSAWAAQYQAKPPTHDAMIFDDGSGGGSANASGKGPGFFAGADGGTRIKRSLIKFDLTAISTAATVTSVELTLIIGQIAGSGGMGCGMMCGPPNRTFSLYQVDYTNAWIEGDTGLTACPQMVGMMSIPFQIPCANMSGTGQGWPYAGCLGAGSGASCGSDVTWEYYNATGSNYWPGRGSASPPNQDFGSASFGSPTYGDHNAVAAVTFGNFIINDPMVFTGDTSMDNPGFTAMVQDWVTNPSHNNGMMIRAASLEGTAQSFIGWWSKDGAAANSNSNLEPQLIVNY